MKIYIKNIEIFASIGCYKHEYEIKTKLLVSLSIGYQSTGNFATGENIINYNNMIKLVKDIINSRHFVYIEELAIAIAQSVKLHNNLISGGFVKVQKCIMGNIVEELSCETSF